MTQEKKIILFGGGRWARVLLEVLCKLTQHSTSISVCSPHNDENMRLWVKEKGLEGVIQVQTTYPDFQSGKEYLAIVVNAAKDHEKTTRYCLAANIPTLVEKPFTLALDTSAALYKYAKNKNTFLATAHVFAFTRYLANFSSICAGIKGITNLSLQWEDPKSEDRYGERKQFDPSLPILHDLLPHAISIIRRVVPNPPLTFVSIDVHRGGAQVFIRIKAGEVLCEIELVRNGKERKRSVEVKSSSEQAAIDFSIEPGVILHAGNTINADPEWNTGMRPIATLLSSFIASASTTNIDERLSPDIAIDAAQIIQAAYGPYLEKQLDWFSAHDNVVLHEDDLRYAQEELLKAHEIIKNYSATQAA